MFLVFFQADKPKAIADQVRIGMTADEVRGVFGGPPRRVARQVVYHRHLELWTYEFPTTIWIEFTCIRGQEARVSRIHQTDARP